MRRRSPLRPQRRRRPLAPRPRSPPPRRKPIQPSTARARRAQLARARAAARARELKELQTPRFRVDEFGREVPDVRAEAAIIYNPETGEVLWENHSKDQRSMASITKVMTALVFLESNTPLSTMVTVQRSDVSHASTTYLRNGFKLTAEDLLNLLLVGSDNAAARALARVSHARLRRLHPADEREGHGARPREHRLRRSVGTARREHVVGLRPGAADRLCRGGRARRRDHAQDLVQRRSVGKRTITAQQHQSDRPQRRHRRRRRQDRIHQPLGLLPGDAAALPQSGQQVAFVVLGAKTNASRFWETRHLFNWMATRTKALLEGDFQQQQQQEPATNSRQQ